MMVEGRVPAGVGPAISVVLPTFNRAPFLPHAIESVLAQTFLDLELIVVDDGSTDGTSDLVGRFTDARVRWLSLGRNRGGSGARNEGIRAARGEVVAFLDSDDTWMPRKLERQWERLRDANDPGAAVVYCMRSLCAPPGDALGAPDPMAIHEGEVFDHLLAGWWIPTSALLVRRADLLAVGGFDERLPSFQDYDLILRLAEGSRRFLAVAEPLLLACDHPGPRISTDPAARLAGFAIVRRRWGPTIRARLGWAAYGRWVAFQSLGSHLAGVRQATERGDRRAALRHCLAIASCLPHPGSARVLLPALALSLLGQGPYESLRRLKRWAARRLQPTRGDDGEAPGPGALGLRRIPSR